LPRSVGQLYGRWARCVERAPETVTLSGKTVIYRINVKRKVDDINEKIKAVNEFFFKRNLDFTVDDKKLIIKTEKDMKKIVEMFGDKFKQLLGLDVDVIETEEADKERK